MDYQVGRLMSVKIKKLSIENLFDEHNVEWVLDDVNVLVGKNGKGKSVILNIIHSLLNKEESTEVNYCKKANIYLNDKRMISRRNDPSSSEFLKIIASQVLKGLSENKKEIKKLAKIKNKEQEEKIKSEMELILEKLSSKDTDAPKGYFVEMGEKEKGKQEEKDKINTTYISTINMSANSTNEIKKSSGEKVMVLDFEIKEEKDAALKKIASGSRSSEEKKTLLDVLNGFFKDTKKEVVIEDDLIVLLEDKKTNIEIEKLSSGERQLIYTFLRVFNSERENQIILLDEPEISLHLSWQEILISSIKKIRDDCQIILVTHSPGIVMDGWMGAYKEIDSIITKAEK